MTHRLVDAVRAAAIPLAADADRRPIVNLIGDATLVLVDLDPYVRRGDFSRWIEHVFGDSARSRIDTARPRPRTPSRRSPT